MHNPFIINTKRFLRNFITLICLSFFEISAILSEYSNQHGTMRIMVVVVIIIHGVNKGFSINISC